MKILLTNDDGIYADGIRTLGKRLGDAGHQLVITAPDRERSAAGHSITIIDPLRAQEVDLDIEMSRAYKINGTPADCVKLGLEKLSTFRPDLIISGINDGPNIGYDVLYSGTVSAAMEGYMLGYKSIAISLATKDYRDFNQGAEYIVDFISDFESLDLDRAVLLNINIPDIRAEELKGFKITKLGSSQYEDGFEERIDPMGNRYFWLTGVISGEEISPDSDIWALNNGYISITPLELNLTDNVIFDFLKEKIK